jgi:hypothetical protein
LAFESPAFANQASTYSAEITRRAVLSWLARTGANNPGIVAGGLVNAADCQLSAPGSGMSVNVGTGEMYIGGTEGGTQGPYYGRVSSTTNLVIGTASPSNPRIDLVCATISDSGYTEPSGGSGNQFTPQVITGTPTPSASLANLLGVGALPASSLLLGYVLVPQSAANIVSADIANIAAPATTWLSGSRGATNIAASQSTSSATYTTLTTPDQVTNVVLPTNGLIMVLYQAMWQETIANTARAQLCLGATQVEIASNNGGPQIGVTIALIGGTANNNTPLSTYSGGLKSMPSNAHNSTADVTTGQVVGGYDVTVPATVGGPCYIFAAAGTYTVSVQFAVVSGGTVTAQQRKLWVQALSFS